MTSSYNIWSPCPKCGICRCKLLWQMLIFVPKTILILLYECERGHKFKVTGGVN